MYFFLHIKIYINIKIYKHIFLLLPIHHLHFGVYKIYNYLQQLMYGAEYIYRW